MTRSEWSVDAETGDHVHACGIRHRPEPPRHAWALLGNLDPCMVDGCPLSIRRDPMIGDLCATGERAALP